MIKRAMALLVLAGGCSVAWAEPPATVPATPIAPTKIDGADVKAKPAEAPKKEESAKLGVGSPAPKLQVQSFIKGNGGLASDGAFEKGKVYVVEFWATWCGPCIKAFPHLSKLQAQYKDQGVNFIGVNIWEQFKDDTLSTVTDFVAKQGDNMAYSVAYDGKDKKTDEAYMKASGQRGIPSAFIVNQDGVIAWQGHPMGMDEPLAKIVAKQWDVAQAKAAADKKAAEEAAAEAANKARQAKMRPLQKKITDAVNAQKWDEALAGLDEMKAVAPEMSARLESSKFFLLLTQANQPAKAYAMKDALLADKQISADAGMLNQIAWTVLDSDEVQTRDFDFAMLFAVKANEAAGGKDGMIMDTLARAHFEKGDKAKAAEVQKKAIELAEAQKADAEMIGEMKASLKRYEATGEEKK
jgi:thiol-disulfide isomerase/thioredoxin